MATVNRKLLELAFTHPFLMHASLAVAHAYDRYLHKPPDNRRTVEECYHFYQSSTLFNKRLRAANAFQNTELDAIWGTAAALALLAFSSSDARTPTESWPLRNLSSPFDLEWLRISQGKMSLWQLANPLRSDSLFRIMAPTYAQMNTPLPSYGQAGVPDALAAACHLTDSSTAETNPYFHAAHALARLGALPDEQVTVGHTEMFARCIHGSFESLLHAKDPVALLLLCLWYRKAARCIWWMELRARVECPAICDYLRTHHGENGAVMAFLPIPAGQ